MVGIVIVSHSARLAEGVVELAREMAGPDVAIVAAGGLDLPGRPLGTDAALVARAVTEAWSDEGVLVLMDLGSAVMSAEMALEMVADERRPRLLLCEAPIVEGAVAAAVAARLGEPLARVAAEARGGLAGKTAHLAASPEQEPEQVPGDGLAGEITRDGPAGEAPGDGPAGEWPADGGHGEGAVEARLSIANPLGLHARPAARFVETVGRFEATVTAENLTAHSGPASARSLNGVATLGVRQGHEVLVRATGPQAREVLEALRDLAARNFDEPAAQRTAASATQRPPQADATTQRPPPADATTRQVPPQPPPANEAPAAGTVLHGLAASPGIAVGPARQLRAAPIEVPRTPADAPGPELDRLDDALEATRRDVLAARDSVAARTGAAYESAIFDAHLLFLKDEALLDPARRLIGEGRNAADAWDRAVSDMAEVWQRLEDEYQRGRVRDLESIRAQVLAHLLAVSRSGGSEPGIVLAADLSPADTAGFDPAVVRGIATALGGPTSHAAILARALGIPAVVGLGAGLLALPEATLLLLDGERGTVRVAPPPADVAAAERAEERRRAAGERARQLADQPAVTRDGTRVEVAANAGSVEDVRRAVAAGADGVGLLRTEFVFQAAAAMPTEQEQEAMYREIARILDGRPLIVRTLDVGADKPLSYLPRETEPNPALGQRGIRLGLARTELLLPQIRAVLRVAAQHPVRLMFPMVATREEVDAALRLVAEARHGLRQGGVAADRMGGPEVGIMIEVPSAAVAAASLAGAVDFFSVGTNDLTQYTMAADRDVTAVARLADAMHPAVLTLIGRAAVAATEAGRWIGVCGELAADPLAVPLLLGLGVRELSVNTASVAVVKQAVREVDLAEAAELARQAILLPSADAVRELVRGR
ncbi:MAG TPA: phosphoenolpyruvate--protein phosphotransferase [Streptosporangiaceae bacterium]|nr:phosphoenolpyruvate--protein phosphotransferase [Streptosporangiaceae bacterium]